MKINANTLRHGNVIQHKENLWIVVKTQHTQPGKGGAYLQVELKNLMDKTKLNERFRSSESIERIHLEEKSYQFLFKENDTYTLMNVKNFEQITVSADHIGNSGLFLEEGNIITVCSHENQVVAITLPKKVVMEVVEADAVVKGQTAATSYKSALLKNGLKILVPTYIDIGAKIVVDTKTCTYVERATL